MFSQVRAGLHLFFIAISELYSFLCYCKKFAEPVSSMFLVRNSAATSLDGIDVSMSSTGSDIRVAGHR